MPKIALTCALFLSFSAFTTTTFGQASEKAEVLLIGVFHFANPGLDAVKTDQINVMTDESQQYLEQVTDQLADFSPTHVLLECEPESSSDYTAELQAYLDGGFELTSRESYQLGFRIAKKAGLTELHCYDDRSVEWEVEPMLAHLSQNETGLFEKFNSTIARLTAEIEQLHESLSLEELMLTHNSEEFDNLNKGIYLSTNVAGAGENFEGATAASSWWQRNFRMYANIQSIAVPNTKVIVIGGQGHTAVIKDFIKLDSDRIGIDAAPYLKLQ